MWLVNTLVGKGLALFLIRSDHGKLSEKYFCDCELNLLVFKSEDDLKPKV